MALSISSLFPVSPNNRGWNSAAREKEGERLTKAGGEIVLQTNS